MKQRKRIRHVLYGLEAVCLASMVCLLAGCGEKGDRQLGVDGYIYVLQTIKQSADSASNFCVVDGWLYYLNDSNTVKRLALKDQEEGLDFAHGEIVFVLSDILSDVPEDELSIGRFSSAQIADYDVDSEGGICCIVSLYANGSDYNVEVAGGILCRQSPEGKLEYWLELPEISAFVLSGNMLVPDSNGGMFVLAGSSILTVDRNGKTTGRLAMEETSQPSEILLPRLLKGEGGLVYYTTENNWNMDIQTFVINDTEELRMTEVPKLAGSMLNMVLYEGIDGLLVKTLRSDGTLYRYNSSEDSLTAVLKWGDSNLVEDDICGLVQIAEDRYLASMWPIGIAHEDLLLLKKTPVEELPEKEILILASLFPSDTLKRSVAEFNMSNDTYHISIESYGADAFGGEANEGAYLRLDAGILSQDPPDLLDLADLEVYKYAERGMLEDLYPYMEGESVVRAENYLDNLLEGYTIDGRLVCIPRMFHFRPVYGIMQEVRAVDSWTMSALMALTEAYPDTVLFGTTLFYEEYMLATFCAPYYLEAFVDWEQEKCSFDSEAFCRLLSWVAAYSGTEGQSDNVLLGMDYIYRFEDYPQYLFQHGDEVISLGFPSADGKGVYIAETEEALGIFSASLHKEAAWEFLKYFLSEDKEYEYDLGLPTSKELLEALALDAVTPQYITDSQGNRVKDRWGNEMFVKWTWFDESGNEVSIFALEQEQVDEVMRMIESIDFTPRSTEKQGIIDIVMEEAQYLLDGSKTAEEVCAVIQNKAQLLLQERNVPQ